MSLDAESIATEVDPRASSGLAARLAPLKGFRPDVQALRGIAVLVVVLFHAQLLPGGFVGVDVFFVISGFVIGRLLVAELDTTGQVSFASFYARRVRRLLPALTTLLVTVLLLAPLLAPLVARNLTQRTGLAAALFSANAYLYRTAGGGYFANAAELNPLLHTWSLSVEEQFYLVMPALLVLAWKVGKRRGRPLAALRLFAAAVLVVSFAACIWFSYGGGVDPVKGLNFAFFSPVTRAWEFAAGLALVVIPVRSYLSAGARRVAVITGLALVVFAIAGFSDATLFPGAAALVPVVGTVLVIFGGTSPFGGSDGGRWLDRRPLIWLGDLSYSWYLWHWPLIVFAGAFWPQAGRLPLVIAAAVSLLPAWLSQRTVEGRFKVAGGVIPRRSALIAACCIALPFLAAAIARPIDSVVHQRPSVQPFVAANAFHIDNRLGCDGLSGAEKANDQGCILGGDGPPSVVLIGDSNAGHLSEALRDAIGDSGASILLNTSSSCPTLDLQGPEAGRLPAKCMDHVQSTLQHLEADPPGLVIVSGSTDGYLRQGELFTRPDEEAMSQTERDASKAAAFEAGLVRSLTRLRASGARVVLVNVMPKPGGGVPALAACSSLAMMTMPDNCLPSSFHPEDRKYFMLADEVEDRAAAVAGVEVWDLRDEICPDDLCRTEVDGRIVYRDGSHISVATSEALAAKVAELLQRPVVG